MRLTVIPGDGIGPEVMNAVIEILQTVRAPFEFDFQDAGPVALRKHGGLLPPLTLTSIEKTKLALLGPNSSISDSLKGKFDLYANLRPIQSLSADLLIVGENGAHAEGRPEKIANYAYQLARKLKRKSVTIVPRAPALKSPDDLFLNTCLRVGKNFPDIVTRNLLAEDCCRQLISQPEQFDLLLTENMDIAILAAGGKSLAGHSGQVSQANLGDKVAVFETSQDSALDITGQNKANPTALIQTSILLLQYVGEIKKGAIILKALKASIQDLACCTEDLGGRGNTQSFTKAIIQNLTAFEEHF